MSKKSNLILIIIAVVLLIGLGTSSYIYWKKYKASKAVKPETEALQGAGDAAEKITDSATQGVLPSINTQSNPLENAPDINPVSKTNPFKNIKTNPFD